MNLRDKRPTNYCKEQCLQLFSGKDAQRNEIASDSMIQKKAGNPSEISKQDKNNHRSAQLMVKLIKNINRQFSQLSLDQQRKIIEANRPFGLEYYDSNRNKVMNFSQDINGEFDPQKNTVCQTYNSDRRMASFRSASRPINYASFENLPRNQSDNGNYTNQNSTLRKLKDFKPVGRPKSPKQKKHQQKKIIQQASQAKMMTHLCENSQKRQNLTSNEYSQQYLRTFISTLLFQQKMKKQLEATNTAKSLQQLRKMASKIIKSGNINKDKIRHNKKPDNVTEEQNVLKTILQKKGSIGSQKLSTNFKLKRSSFHIAIAYGIYLRQRKKLGFSFQKFEELDPTRHSRQIRRQKQANDKMIQEKKKSEIKQ